MVNMEPEAQKTTATEVCFLISSIKTLTLKNKCKIIRNQKTTCF